MQDSFIRESIPNTNLNFNKDYDFSYFNDRFLDHNSAISSKYVNEDCLFNSLNSDINVTALSSNIQSLPSKYDSLLNFLAVAESKNCCFDIVALQEIWQLRDESLFQLNDYIYFGSERKKSRGGGVGFFVKSNLGAKKLKTSSIFIENIFESLVLELTLSSKEKVIIVNIYRPNNHKILSQKDQFTEFFRAYDELLNRVSQLHRPIFIFADMNIDLLKIRQNDHAKLLLDASASVGLTQIITKATRIQGTSFSLIDHIFTNVEDSWSAVLTDSFSDHFSTICHIANRSKKSANPVKKVRSFTQDNFEKFHTFLSHSSWQSVFASTCPEEAWQNFWNLFYTAFDLHFPFKIIKPNKGFIPIKGFMTPGLLVSRKEKLKLDLKRKTIPSEENKISYKSYLAVYNKTIKLSKKRYFEDKFAKFSGNPKKTWDTINEISNKANSKSVFPDFIEFEGKFINSSTKMADSFNDYFSQAGVKVAESVGISKHSFKEFLPPPQSNSFYFAPLNFEDVRNAIKCLKDKKSTDINNVSVNFLLKYEFLLSFPLAHIFNLSIEKGIFPSGLKTSKVIPVFKKEGSINDIQNFRPIAMVNTFGKVLEKIMAFRLTNFLNRNNFFYENQFGFTEGRGTNEAILKIVNFISESLNQGDYCIGIFLDIKKCFDTIPHDILLLKLENYGIRGILNDWFKSFLSNREKMVLVNGVLSSVSACADISVLQGSILGVLLFLIFINDFMNVSDLLKILYADDSSCLASGPDLKELETLVNKELQKISLWFKCNKLVLNDKKSKCMLFSVKRKKENINLFLNNNDLDEFDEKKLLPLEQITNNSKEPFIRVLGFHINETLDIQDHGSILASKLAKAVFLLNRVKHLMSLKTMKMLYYAHFHSHLSFCSMFFPMFSQKMLNRINILQKKAIRAVAKSSPKAHTNKLFFRLEILPLNLLIDFNLLQFMHRYINHKVPETFANTWPTIFERNNNMRDLRRSGEFYIKLCHYEKLKRHPLFNLPKKWNELKDPVKFMLDCIGFKSSLKKFLLNHIDISECKDPFCYTCGKVTQPVY